MSKPRAVPTAAAFEWPVRVYWEDTDAGGIVFYANYLKFFERARTEWLRSLGLEQQKLREQLGGMFVVTDTQVRYQRPARLDDLLLVTAELAEAGRASLTIRQSASLQPACATSALAPAERAEGSGTPQVVVQPALLCEGSIRIGWVDAATLRPQRIPAHLLDALHPSR
ncbi:MAG: YbgC/FadM family acyl-CoA thioesterase [Hydrogenophaga sp.]|nr:YbgC/FadM family acyl-CoA thioesterase [Hydrogenophaga sp.]